MVHFQDVVAPALASPTHQAMAVMTMSFMDWMACGLAGQDEPTSRVTKALVLSESGTPQASLFGGGRVPARAAALANGATSHALDYDDTHFAHIGHPSVAVLPAVMAVAEQEGLDFEQMLRAALAGCEASIRFGLLFGRNHYQIGYHQTATAGAFGATVGVAVLLNLPVEQRNHALGLVSTRASGLKSQFGTMGKPFNAGLAASNGVESVWLAAHGFQSAPDALTATNGFLDTHGCDGALESGGGFLMEQVSHKFHACCHGLHAMLEALNVISCPEPDDVVALEIETHPRWLTVCNQTEPETGLGAKFSYRTVAAMALLGHDTAALGTYSDRLAIDPAVCAVRDRVQAVANETLSETQARVVLTTRAGRQEAFHDLMTPLGLTERAHRLQAKTRALIGSEMASRMQAAVDDKSLPDVIALMHQKAVEPTA